jgi:hypothetical protein
MVEKNTYTCFTCLMESKTPGVCSECGAVIPELDTKTAIVAPPKSGNLIVSNVLLNEQLIAEIEGIADKQSSETFDNYGVESMGDHISIKCNEIAAKRLQEKLLASSNKIIREECDIKIEFQSS